MQRPKQGVAAYALLKYMHASTGMVSTATKDTRGESECGSESHGVSPGFDVNVEFRPPNIVPETMPRSDGKQGGGGAKMARHHEDVAEFGR